MLDVLAFPALESDHQYKGSDYRLARLLPYLKGAAMTHGMAVHHARCFSPPRLQLNTQPLDAWAIRGVLTKLDRSIGHLAACHS